MKYIMVNFTKQEYIDPIALGAAKGSPVRSVMRNALASQLPWLLLFAELLEVDAPLREDANELSGEWAGDQLILVREGDSNTDFMPKEEIAMYAISDKKFNRYKYVRSNFQDITAELQIELAQRPDILEVLSNLQALSTKADKALSMDGRLTEPVQTGLDEIAVCHPGCHATTVI